jgi:hypothetical protein
LSCPCAGKNRCTLSCGSRIDRDIVRWFLDTRRQATRLAPGDAAPNRFRVGSVDSYAVRVLCKFWHRLLLAGKTQVPAILRLTEFGGFMEQGS